MSPEERLDARLSRVEAELAGIMRQVEVFAPVAVTLAEIEYRLGASVDDVDELGGAFRRLEDRVDVRLREVRDLCAAIAADAQAERDARAKNRTTIAVAVIGGSFTVITAIIAAVAAILTAGG